MRCLYVRPFMLHTENEWIRLFKNKKNVHKTGLGLILDSCMMNVYTVVTHTRNKRGSETWMGNVTRQQYKRSEKRRSSSLGEKQTGHPDRVNVGKRYIQEKVQNKIKGKEAFLRGYCILWMKIFHNGSLFTKSKTLPEYKYF